MNGSTDRSPDRSLRLLVDGFLYGSRAVLHVRWLGVRLCGSHAGSLVTSVFTMHLSLYCSSGRSAHLTLHPLVEAFPTVGTPYCSSDGSVDGSSDRSPDGALLRLVDSFPDGSRPLLLVVRFPTVRAPYCSLDGSPDGSLLPRVDSLPDGSHAMLLNGWLGGSLAGSLITSTRRRLSPWIACRTTRRMAHRITRQIACQMARRLIHGFTHFIRLFIALLTFRVP